MFGNNWLINIRFVATSNLGRLCADVAKSSSFANTSIGGMKAQMGGFNTSTMAASANMAKLVASTSNLGTAMSGIIAASGAAFMGDALKNAGQLQQTLLSIKNETGATSAQMGNFYNSAFKIANQAGMTPEQGGEMLRTISRLTAGQFDVGKMVTIAPAITDYASKVHFNRPEIGIEDAARTGIQMAHLFQTYQPDKIKSLLDLNYRLSGMMAEAPDAALRQMSYYVPLFKALKISDETSVGVMALLDRAGFRNKVGTNVRALALESLGPLQLTSSAQKGKRGILTEMGLFKNGKFAWNTPDGGLDYFGELGAIANWAKTQSDHHVPMSKVVQEMVGALGKQGATVGALFLNQEMPGILDGIRKYLADPNVGLKAAGTNRDAGLNFQFSRATSNLTAVMTELGYPWLKDVTAFFKGLGDNLHSFQAWLHGHRDTEKQIGAAVAGITAIAGIRFTVGTASLLISGAKALGMFATVAPGVGLAAKSLAILDGVFLAGMGGRVVGIATKFGLLSGAVSGLSAVFGTAAVAGLPAAFSTLGASLLAVAGPLTVFTATVAGLMALTAKPVGSDENTIRPGGNAKIYGSKSYWENFLQHHGANAVPKDVLNQLHLIHAVDAAHRPQRPALAAPAAWHAPIHPHREQTREVHHHHQPISVTNHITVNGSKDPQKTGDIIGAAISHHLSKVGLTAHSVLAPGLSGNAVGAAH